MQEAEHDFQKNESCCFMFETDLLSNKR